MDRPRAALVTLMVMVGCRQKAPPPPAPAPAAPAVEARVEAAPPEPKTAERVWLTESADRKATLELRKGETCTLHCFIGATEVWSTGTCVGEAQDFRFVSSDCKAAAILYPSPVRAGKWAPLVLIRMLTDGKVAQELTDVDLEVDSTPSRFKWLGGALGEFGEKPHYSADGRTVEYQVIAPHGRVVNTLGLDGQKVVLPKPPPG